LPPSAAFFAPSSIATKYGLEVVFTISETPIFPAPPLEDELEELPPQAVKLSAPRVRTAPAARRRVAAGLGALELNIETPVFVAPFRRQTTMSCIM
jgi:hypothetical protein